MKFFHVSPRYQAIILAFENLNVCSAEIILTFRKVIISRVLTDAILNREFWNLYAKVETHVFLNKSHDALWKLCMLSYSIPAPLFLMTLIEKRSSPQSYRQGALELSIWTLCHT